jgi:two-component system response regulator FixJ
MVTTPTVFVVDDDPGFRSSLVTLMRATGLAVEDYASAHAFLESYQGARPGCLLLDVRMPGLSGLTLQEVLRSKQIQIPIIFITAHGSIPLAVQAVKAGAVDFLEKPFDSKELLARIRQALHQDELRQQEATRHVVYTERFYRLSPRERQVMALVVTGRSNKAIGLELNISPRTVEYYRKRVMEKMGAESLPELIRISMMCAPGGPNGV